MKIGIAFSVKPDAGADDGPDDLFEEFDRPETVEAIASAIRGLGFDVDLLGDGREFLERVLSDPPDFVFNIAEGQGVGRSREARVPAVCEMLGIPCSGSDPLTLAAALDKETARLIASGRGVICPRGVSLPIDTSSDILENHVNKLLENSQTLILKPSLEGSSKGIRGDCLARSRAEAAELFHRLARDYRQPILIEEFIDGEEVTVGVVGNGERVEVLGTMRILPRDADGPFVYSLEVKRDWLRRVLYEAPARLPASVLERLETAARLAYSAMGCRDLARIDFRLKDGVPFFLEINPLPGLAPVTSDLVILAEGYGIGHPELIGRVLSAALEREGLTEGARRS